jgi:class 3 adenylate cyclase
MPNLPTGTVTFAFSDIEGSTELLKRLGDERYGDLLGVHRRLVRDIVAAHDGQEIDTQGDAFFCSFPRARRAVAACVEIQRAHVRQDWPDGARVRVRIGLHTGEPAVGDEGYTGLDVVRAARIAAVARGGRILLSETTHALIGAQLPAGVRVQALGPRPLKDIDRPEPLHEVLIDGTELAVADGEPAANDQDGASDVPVAVPQAMEPPAPPAPLTPGPQPPGLPDIQSIIASLPGFARDAAQASLRDPRSARESIEARVLGDLRASLSRPRPGRRRDRQRGDEAAPSPSAASVRTSVADEVERLRALRDAGALTDEQYERAVERVVDGRT